MKKILTLLLSLPALSSLCTAGCNYKNDNKTNEDDTVTEQNIQEEAPDENGDDSECEPAPVPRLPDKRHDNNKPRPRPLPHPHHHK